MLAAVALPWESLPILLYTQKGNQIKQTAIFQQFYKIPTFLVITLDDEDKVLLKKSFEKASDLQNPIKLSKFDCSLILIFWDNSSDEYEQG